VTTADTQQVRPSTNSVTLDGNAVIKVGDELVISADHLDSQFDMRELDARGNVYGNELDTTFASDSLLFDTEARTGDLYNVVYRHYPYTMDAAHIHITPNLIQADNATLTTSPPHVAPLVYFKAEHFTINHQKHRMVGRNVSLYIGKSRVLTEPYFSSHTSDSTSKNQNVRQQFGYNSNDGAFASVYGYTSIAKISTAESATYSSKGHNAATGWFGYNLPYIPIDKPASNDAPPPGTTQSDSVMYMLRSIARVGKIPVPEGDPLRFHDFTAPSPTAGVFSGALRGIASGVTLDGAYNQRIYGSPVTVDYLTKWPEAGFHTTVPVGAVRPDFPIGVDADEVRKILRKPEFDFSAAVLGGKYKEMPMNVHMSRTQYTASLDTRPFMLANNLLCYTGVSYIDNRYDIGTELRYPQATLALQQIFTDLTGIGAQITIATPKGASPFAFDALGAAHEFDIRGQYGNNYFVVGALLQYDLQLHDFYDQQFSIGPNLHGLMPRLTYDLLTRTTGFTVDVIGLTY